MVVKNIDKSIQSIAVLKAARQWADFPILLGVMCMNADQKSGTNEKKSPCIKDDQKESKKSKMNL